MQSTTVHHDPRPHAAVVWVDGWHALVADAAERSIVLAPDAGGQRPEMVAVSAVDRVGAESAPVILFPDVSRKAR